MDEETVPVVLSQGNYGLVFCCVCGLRFFARRTEEPIACPACYMSVNPTDLDWLFTSPTFDCVNAWGSGVIEWKTTARPVEELPSHGLESGTDH